MAEHKPRVLVVDDGEAYARAVADAMPELSLLAPAGSEQGRMPDGPSALRYLERNARNVDLLLLDMQFDVDETRLFPLEPGASARRTRRFQGVAILRKIRARWPELPVVLLTSQEDLSLVDADAELASHSMTYVLDGDDIDALRIRIHGALADRELVPDDAEVLWGRDPTMRSLRRRLSVLARGSMPVILEGETGTGKSYLAERFVHRNSGRNGAFVVLDLSTVPRELLPAQLFGVLRGAFTGAVSDRKGVFEAAHRGTLFLDEIQNAPLETQKQLLLALQDRRVRPLGGTRDVPVDVKVVAASNQKLEQAVAERRFRADLYMRLSPATRVEIPPLRERLADLRYLAARFAELAVAERDLAELKARVCSALGLGRDAKLVLQLEREAGATDSKQLALHLPLAAWKLLQAHAWPGNLRELATVMQNVATFTLVAAVDAQAAGLAIKSPRLQVDPGLVSALLAGSSALRATLPPPASGAVGGNGFGMRAADDRLALPGGTALGDVGGEGVAAGVRSGVHAGVPEGVRVNVRAGRTLNAVAQDVERQYLLALFAATGGSFSAMAESLLGDATRTRAVRLRFNQLGLKVRALRRP
ncbi:MAG TPA: sigma 54-interacting transcriptional regulator [Polyangiales bacterium]|nr:sigma 54-interacting transcriptional regulator [Polyangiales bacterium]